MLIEEELIDIDSVDAICLDMDGTIADLYNVEDWLEMLTDYNAVPYAAASPLVDMSYLNDLIAELSEDYNIPTIIISWGSKSANDGYDMAVEAAKSGWLQHYLPNVDKFCFLPHGTDKGTVVEDFENPVLFDDEQENLDDWYWENAFDGSDGDRMLDMLEDFLDYKRETT